MSLAFRFANLLGAVYHEGTIKFSPDGNALFSPVGNKIILHDVRANKSNAIPLQTNCNISKICIHPKTTLMLAASTTNVLYMISLACGRLLHLKEFKSFDQIGHVSFSSDGRYYCVCGSNLALIYVTPGSLVGNKSREIAPFRLLKKFRINHDVITDASWSEDSRHICIANQDASLHVISVLDEQREVVQLKGHSDPILNCFFANRNHDDKQIYSVTKNCQLFVWDVKGPDDSHKKIKSTLNYVRSHKCYIKLASEALVTASDFNAKAKLLVVGYSTGHYSLYMMPSAHLLYSIESNPNPISSISINSTGDWIAFGSKINAEAKQSRLFVWEWQTKSHILDCSGSGATTSNMHECLSYSLDGTHIVSGDQSGRIKVWSALSGATVATFGEEHTGPIKSIKFAPNKSGKVIISASVDGTIRAYDLNKYKNFRTFLSPVGEKRPQFICLDIDSTGEFIAAGTFNYFEIYLFSLQTGKFLEYLTGHEGSVSGVAFSPVSNLLVSTSWDSTVKIWNLFEGSKCIRDTISLSHEVITVTFRPDGGQFAVSTSNGQIAFFDPHTSDQVGAPIEGQGDLGTTQLATELSRDNKKYFISLNYSADGSFLIAGGKSNFICIYHAREKILMKKIALTFNLSMDGIFDFISNRKQSEFGYNIELLNQRREERTTKPIQLPGVLKSDLSDRYLRPVMSVDHISFSPTMRSFAAATTDGILVYSLDIAKNFEPYKLASDVDPLTVRKALKSLDYSTALIQTIQLNDRNLFEEVIEQIPLEDIDVIINILQQDYIKRLLISIGRILPDTKHIEYYLRWIQRLLFKHGISLKGSDSGDIIPIIRTIHQNIYRHYSDMRSNSEYCKYSMEFLTRFRKEPYLEEDENLMIH